MNKQLIHKDGRMALIRIKDFNAWIWHKPINLRFIKFGKAVKCIYWHREDKRVIPEAKIKWLTIPRKLVFFWWNKNAKDLVIFNISCQRRTPKKKRWGLSINTRTDAYSTINVKHKNLITVRCSGGLSALKGLQKILLYTYIITKWGLVRYWKGSDHCINAECHFTSSSFFPASSSSLNPPTFCSISSISSSRHRASLASASIWSCCITTETHTIWCDGS